MFLSREATSSLRYRKLGSDATTRAMRSKANLTGYQRLNRFGTSSPRAFVRFFGPDLRRVVTLVLAGVGLTTARSIPRFRPRYPAASLGVRMTCGAKHARFGLAAWRKNRVMTTSKQHIVVSWPSQKHGKSLGSCPKSRPLTLLHTWQCGSRVVCGGSNDQENLKISPAYLTMREAFCLI